MAADAGAERGVEIERKFLVTRPPAGLESHPARELQQGYLALDPEGAVVRLRRDGVKTLMTIKAGGGLKRAEEEFLIDGPRFERLWALTDGRRIEKTRYDVPGGHGFTIEVDIYHGDLDGLVTAEVEGSSVEAVMAYEPPSWCRLEVTGDARYGNARLAIDGVPDRSAVSEHGLLVGESLTEGFRQVVLAQIDTAADALQGADAEDHGTAVHTSRKAFKRGRALLRLAAPGLESEQRHAANATFREAGRDLAGARDAAVVVQTLDKVLRKVGDPQEGLTVEAVAPLRDRLVAARDEAEQASREGDSEGAAVDAVLQRLVSLRVDVASWELGREPAEALADGFTQIYRRGEKRLAAATHSSGDVTEAFHDLRKRAKDLWHAAEFLEVAAPKRFSQLAADAHQLADLIGDDHDLAVLTDRIGEEALAAGLGDEALEPLLTAIRRRRKKLQRRALRLADEVYGRKASRYADRVAELG